MTPERISRKATKSKVNQEEIAAVQLAVHKKREFVKALAAYLVNDQAFKGMKQDREWIAIRNWTPLFGYPTIEEAEEQLKSWLNIP